MKNYNLQCMTRSGGVGAGCGKGRTEKVAPRCGKMLSAGAKDFTETRLGGVLEGWLKLEKGDCGGRGGDGSRCGSLASR